jgi:membrane-associated protease RseP (regulator of RpoE activity)
VEEAEAVGACRGIMFAGPAMNLLLALIFFTILIMGVGINGPVPTISTVSKCAIPATQTTNTCTKDDQLTPAAAVGLQPGDKFVSFNGTRVHSYTRLQNLIRASGGKNVQLVVDRHGQRMTFNVHLITNKLQDLNNPNKIVTTGFLGISPVSDWRRGGPGDVVSIMGTMTSRTLESIVNLPDKMVGVWNAAIGHHKRDPNGPIGVVGASRLGGEVLASHNPGRDKLSFFIFLLASINFAVGMFNLIPLLPLDGGHMAGALWEGIKKAFARIFGRSDPGYVDVAKALPLTYAMAAVILVMGALLVYADLVNPVTFKG